VGTIAFAQVPVSGRVVDASGQELPGVNIAVKGTTTGALSDANGNFSINVPSKTSTLVFSYVGYATQEVRIGNLKVFKIVMAEESKAIDEVVVIAYGTAKKKDLTGAMTALDGKVVSDQVQSSVSRALEGTVPGIQISAVDGQPGLDAGIRVRGLGSASQNNSNALVIIDGVPASDASNVNVLSSINPNDIENISVLKDAASTALYGSRGANGVVIITTKKGKQGKAKISFQGRWGWDTVNNNGMGAEMGVKDLYEHAWLSIYNAVKTGKYSGSNADAVADPATFASQHLFNFSGSVSNFNRNKLGNWMSYNVPGAVYTKDGTGATASSTMTGAYLVNTDGKLNPQAKYLYDSFSRENALQDALLRTAFRQEYNISAAGGTDAVDYNFSLGMLDEPSFVVASNFKRYTARSNVNAKITNWLKAGANVAFTYRNLEQMPTRWKQRNPGDVSQNPFAWINSATPIFQLYQRDASGNYVYDADGNKLVHKTAGDSYSPLGNVADAGDIDRSAIDPVKFFKEADDRTIFYDTDVKGYVEATFLKDFKATVNLSYSRDDQVRTRYISNASGMIQSQISAMGKERNNYGYLDTQALLDYNHDFGKHHVDALVGHEYWQYNTEGNSWKAGYSLIENFQAYANFVGINTGYSTFAGIGGSIDKQALESYFSRANYIYDNKYYVSASLRRDGSSKFKKAENRWGTFWSVGGGWRISSEDFMQDYKDIVQNLKVRASYGVIGNQNGVAMHSGYQTWGYGGSSWSYSGTTVTPTAFSISKGAWTNDALTWENVHTIDAGVDFSILNRINGTIDYYNRLTANAIWSQPVSYMKAGQTTMDMNSAKIRNRGIEIDLTVDLIKNKDLYWNFSTNGTHYTTEVTEVPAGTGSAALDGAWIAGADGWGASGANSASGCFLRGIGKPYYNIYMYKYGGVAGNPGKDYFDAKGNKNVTADRGKALYYHKVTAADAATFGAKAGDDVLVSYYTNGGASRYEFGDAVPKWIGGFSSYLKYKDFDLNVLFAYQLGGHYLSLDYANHLYKSEYFNVSIAKDLVGNTWTESNQSAKYPMVVYNNTYGNGATIGSSMYTDMSLFSASYITLKNITIGYNIPKAYLSKVGLSNVRLYASADNLWIKTAQSGVDPRYSLVGGFEMGVYPYPYARNISLGINVDF